MSNEVKNMGKKYDIRKLTLSGMMLALIVVGAYIKIPIPYVPFTLQFLFVTLVGQLLGAKTGSIVVATYILMGLVGMPVFTSGGGLAYVFQPTFGYLLGFVLAAAMSGFIVENFRFKFRRYVANFLGIVCMYICGVPYLYFLYLLYFQQKLEIVYVLQIGIFAQLPGDIILSCISAHMATCLDRYINMGKNSN